MQKTIDQQFIAKADRYLKIIAWAKARYSVNGSLATMRNGKPTRYTLIENLAAVKIMGFVNRHPGLGIWSVKPKRRQMFYYVAMHYETGRSVLIAGPYTEESRAESAKERARDLAVERDGYNWFNLFSLGKSEANQKTIFGAV